MNRVQLLKLAYARGAFLALQEAGYHEKVAEDLALKIANRDALDVLEDVGIGAGVGGLGGAALGAGAGALTGRFARNIPGEARLLSMSGAQNPTLRRALGATGYVPEALSSDMIHAMNNPEFASQAAMAGQMGSEGAAMADARITDALRKSQYNGPGGITGGSRMSTRDPFSMPVRGAMQYGAAGLGAGALGGGLVGGLAGE